MRNYRTGASVLNISIAVVVMLIILSTITFSALDSMRMQKLDNMYNDIRMLKEKVEIYYLNYGKLPILEEYTSISNIPTEVLNGNDNSKYYKININALKNLTLSTTINEESFFIINEQSHTIYYPKGIEIDGKKYYRLPEEYSQVAPVVSYVRETSTVAGVEKERTAPIPVGYTASQVDGENTISGGLVIYQTDTAVTAEKNSAEHISAMETYNQYVWIPVDDINDMVMCKQNKEGSVCNLTLQGNELVCSTHGYSTATVLTADNINTTGLAGRLYGVYETLKETTTEGDKIYQTNMDFTINTQTFTVTSLVREPDLVTEYDKDDATSGNNYMYLAGIEDQTASSLKAQLNADYIEMAKSVAKYGGFYVSRYEAGENGASKKNQNVLTASTSTLGNYLKGDSWYGLYNILRNNTGVNTGVVKSHMIWRKPIRPNNKIYRYRSRSRACI